MLTFRSGLPTVLDGAPTADGDRAYRGEADEFELTRVVVARGERRALSAPPASAHCASVLLVVAAGDGARVGAHAVVPGAAFVVAARPATPVLLEAGAASALVVFRASAAPPK